MPGKASVSPGVLDGYAGDRQRSPCGFPAVTRSSAERFRGVRTSGTSQRNETWPWDLVSLARNSPPISTPGSAPRRVLVVADNAAIGLLLGLAMHPPGHGIYAPNFWFGTLDRLEDRFRRHRTK
jgi:hypothetical protein